MKIAPLENKGMSAGLWVNRVSSVVGGWGCQSRGGGGAYVRGTAGCQVTPVCEWHIKAEKNMVLSLTFFFSLTCLPYKQNTKPSWYREKKRLWLKQRGGCPSWPKHTTTNRHYGNRIFDLKRSAGFTTSYSSWKGGYSTPWWPTHGTTDLVLCTCLTEVGVQIHSYYSSHREVAKPEQGQDFNSS